MGRLLDLNPQTHSHSHPHPHYSHMLAHMLAHTHTHTTHTCLHTLTHTLLTHACTCSHTDYNTITLVHRTEESISITHTYSANLTSSLQYLVVKRISLLVAKNCLEARIFVA